MDLSLLNAFEACGREAFGAQDSCPQDIQMQRFQGEVHLQVDQSLLNAFEACGPEAFGAQAGWGAALSSSLMHDLSRYRDYR